MVEGEGRGVQGAEEGGRLTFLFDLAFDVRWAWRGMVLMGV